EGTLQLDPEALRAEGGEQAAAEALAAGGVAALPGAGEGAVAGAAGEADESLGVLLQPVQARPRRFGAARCVVAGVRVGRGDETAEIAIPRVALDQERHMHELRLAARLTDRNPVYIAGFRPIDIQVDGELGAGQGAEVEVEAGLGELARAPDPV